MNRNRYTVLGIAPMILEVGATRLVVLGLLVFLAACSPPAFWNAEKNEDLIAFEENVDLCRASICQIPFPENRRCMQALGMVEKGRPKVEGEAQYIHYLQLRINFADTYSDWLEGEAGKSVWSRGFCSKKLEFLDSSMKLGDEVTHDG